MEKHSVSRMIGAPPGYVGYDEGGALTEAVRRRPYQVVLFDEVEKAHPDVFNVLLQVLDDGRLTDGQGRTVDFRNTLIIMTSNLGSEFLAAAGPTARRRRGGAPAGHGRRCAATSGRSSSTGSTRSSSSSASAASRWTPSSGSSCAGSRSCWPTAAWRIAVDAGALHWLGERGYDPVYGARPLKRVIQKELIDPIARKLLAGELADGSVIEVTPATTGSKSARCW